MPPHSAVRAYLAERLFRHAVRTLPVQVLLPGGERLAAGPAGSPIMRIERPAAFFHRLGVDAKIGFGEAYMAGDWTSPELADLLTPFAARAARLVPPWLHGMRRRVDRLHPATDEPTLRGARHNARRHYVSNDLFAAFLDETMSYSAAWFDGQDLDLAAAQRHKIDGMLDFAGVGNGTHLLEIGTGWGELALRAGRRGATVTSLTISAEQKEFAERRIAQAGLSDRVRVLLRDYREAEGRFDAVVSVEMVEAVGARYWPTYFTAIDRLLRPGGRVGLQTITMSHERMLATRDSYTWVHKYVFPGGIIPSVTAIEQALGDTSLRIDRRRDFGQDYGRTLRLWRERFAQRWPDIAGLGFDETFRRMWEFYLAYSEAGFRSGYLGVSQFRMVKGE